MSPEVLLTDQVARTCSAHHTTIMNWVNKGKLKAYVTPGDYRCIRKDDFLKFMGKCQIFIPLICG